MSQNTQQQWDEAQKACENYKCAECGSRLGTFNLEDKWLARCAQNKEHEGWDPLRSATQAHREGEGLAVAVKDQIERRSPVASGAEMAVRAARAQHQWDLAPASAAMFISQCEAVGLDPFFNEAVPLVFNSKRRAGFQAVVFFPTRNGRALLAKRECPDLWIRPPQVRPITDREEKKKLGFGEDDWVAEAKGETKETAPNEPLIIARAYYRWEYDRDKGNPNIPAPKRPQNQAQVRAERWFYQEAFPDAEYKARVAQAKVLQEEGVAPEELDNIIEGTYKIIEDDDGPRPPRDSSTRRPQRDRQESRPAPPRGAPEQSGPAKTDPAPQDLKDAIFEMAKRTKVADTIAALSQYLKPKGIPWGSITIGQAEAMLKELGALPIPEEPADEPVEDDDELPF